MVYSRITKALLAFVVLFKGIYALGSEPMSKKAKLKIVNLSTREVRVQDGEVNYLNRWKENPSRYYYLKPTESRLKEVPCNTYYCTSVDACREPSDDVTGVFDYFDTYHKKYVIFAIGYGASLYIGNQFGNAIFSKIGRESKGIAAGIERVALLLAKGNDTAAAEVLGSINGLTTDTEITGMLKAISKRIADGLSNEIRTKLKDEAGPTMAALGMGYLSDQALQKYGPEWLKNLYEIYPNVTTALVKTAPVFLTQAASQIAPKVAKLIVQHPYIAAKKVVTSIAAYKLWHWYQTSLHASTTITTASENSFEDEQQITVYIKDYNPHTICLETSEY